MIKYIFFDFDGVLAESVNVKTEAFRTMYLQHGEEFAQRVVNHHVANGGVSRFEKVKLYNGEWLGEDVSEKRVAELADTFSRLAVEGVINAPEVEGATAFLENSSQYVKYIITGTPTSEIKLILRERNMAHFFKEVYGSPEKKGFWVKKILSENPIDPKECVFIGDALADYEAAVKNNVHFILRETGENENLFLDFKGFKINDLTKLNQQISVL